jgi:hypothetical protein
MTLKGASMRRLYDSTQEEKERGKTQNSTDPD